MAEVTILPDGIRATADQDETLLGALGRAGLRYRVGCRRGGCGICKVRLRARRGSLRAPHRRQRAHR